MWYAYLRKPYCSLVKGQLWSPITKLMHLSYITRPICVIPRQTYQQRLWIKKQKSMYISRIEKKTTHNKNTKEGCVTKEGYVLSQLGSVTESEPKGPATLPNWTQLDSRRLCVWDWLGLDSRYEMCLYAPLDDQTVCVNITYNTF